MMLLATSYFTDKGMAVRYLQKINRKLPRYIRDHLQVILKALEGSDGQGADSALDFCLKNDILSGYDFEQVLFIESPRAISLKTEIRLLDKNNLEKANQTPEKSNLRDYETIINQ